jgi:predicted phosphohydrolase
MNIYAISDLHLSFSSDKPMSVFGAGWENHFEKIKKDWIAKVKEEDIVLIAGDISWAMKLSDAETDLKAIATLPGRKVLIRGNHDFWWSGIGKVRQSAPDNSFYFLNIDACKIDDFVFVG